MCSSKLPGISMQKIKKVTSNGQIDVHSYPSLRPCLLLTILCAEVVAGTFLTIHGYLMRYFLFLMLIYLAKVINTTKFVASVVQLLRDCHYLIVNLLPVLLLNDISSTKHRFLFILCILSLFHTYCRTWHGLHKGICYIACQKEIK
jgi:hypothetical protein